MIVVLSLVIGIVTELDIKNYVMGKKHVGEFTFGDQMGEVDKFDVLVMYVRSKHQNDISKDEDGKREMEKIIGKYCDAGVLWLNDYCSKQKSEIKLENLFDELSDKLTV